MCLILNIIFSGVIVILAYKSMITFCFTLWLLSVMNKSIKDPLLNLMGSLCSSKFTTSTIVIPASLFIKKANCQLSLANFTY